MVKTVNKRYLRNLDIVAFGNDIAEWLQLQDIDQNDANMLESNFKLCSNEILDVHAPLISKQIKQRKQSPCYDNDIHFQR